MVYTLTNLDLGDDIARVRSITDYRVVAYGDSGEANRVQRVVSDCLEHGLYRATNGVYGVDVSHIEIWQGDRLVDILWPDASKAKGACAEMYYASADYKAGLARERDLYDDEVWSSR